MHSGVTTIVTIGYQLDFASPELLRLELHSSLRRQPQRSDKNRQRGCTVCQSLVLLCALERRAPPPLLPALLRFGSESHGQAVNHETSDEFLRKYSDAWESLMHSRGGGLHSENGGFPKGLFDQESCDFTGFLRTREAHLCPKKGFRTASSCRHKVSSASMKTNIQERLVVPFLFSARKSVARPRVM